MSFAGGSDPVVVSYSSQQCLEWTLYFYPLIRVPRASIASAQHFSSAARRLGVNSKDSICHRDATELKDLVFAAHYFFYATLACSQPTKDRRPAGKI